MRPTVLFFSILCVIGCKSPIPQSGDDVDGGLVADAVSVDVAPDVDASLPQPMLTNLDITPLSDAEGRSVIYAPSMTGVRLGKWQIAAAHDDVLLNRLTFQVVYSATNLPATTLGNFAELSLYDGATLVATANYVNGDVVFTGMHSTIPEGGYKVYTLKGNINASGVMTNNTPLNLVVKSDAPIDIEARSLQTGYLLGRSSINYDLVSNAGPDEHRFAPAPVYVFHDAYPAILPFSVGGTLQLDPRATIARFTIANRGTRDLRIGSLAVTVLESGLVGGTIGDFRLYEDNGVGGLGRYIAQNSTALTWSNQSSLISFSSANDQNCLLDNLVVAPGASRTFIVTGDTSAMLNGKTSGTVTLSTKINGARGWNNVSAWNSGDLVYYYTPVGNSEQGPFSASDSYPITWPTLVYSL